jgi:hypothetical protein
MSALLASQTSIGHIKRRWKEDSAGVEIVLRCKTIIFTQEMAKTTRSGKRGMEDQEMLLESSI